MTDYHKKLFEFVVLANWMEGGDGDSLILLDDEYGELDEMVAAFREFVGDQFYECHHSDRRVSFHRPPESSITFARKDFEFNKAFYELVIET